MLIQFLYNFDLCHVKKYKQLSIAMKNEKLMNSKTENWKKYVLIEDRNHFINVNDYQACQR